MICMTSLSSMQSLTIVHRCTGLNIETFTSFINDFWTLAACNSEFCKCRSNSPNYIEKSIIWLLCILIWSACIACFCMLLYAAEVVIHIEKNFVTQRSLCSGYFFNEVFFKNFWKKCKLFMMGIRLDKKKTDPKLLGFIAEIVSASLIWACS